MEQTQTLSRETYKKNMMECCSKEGLAAIVSRRKSVTSTMPQPPHDINPDIHFYRLSLPGGWRVL